MKGHLQEAFFSLLLAGVAAFLCVAAMDIPGGAHGSIAPATFPSAITFAIALLALLNVAASLLKGKKADTLPAISRQGILNLILFIVLSTAYIWAMSVAGFVVSTFFYLILMPLLICLISADRKGLLAKPAFWARVIAFALIGTGIIYGVFVEMLKVRF
ncbi:tripartite tricarboxylate transporter TctB family protein [Kushneria indalinina]|uniref:Tripartite tricarboxylate transporter TctB family protein n=1 Tax=Kushneria indalinina DSM 14324 TaxID=1122140 RepID=A0A3D9E078_9GAMM|nr:tripartite tricarboxylate transporter TctB family protein [Kushneria indalinina]REC96453.1 tripartite tricarboxylate transporter TctB family protein [Kushneria indalinina DSM 14324]